MTMSADLQAFLRLHQSGQLAEAEAGYRSILAVNPDDAHALHFLGVIALQQDNPDSAADLIDQALLQLPDEPVFLCNLGQARTRLGQHNAAKLAYTRAVTIAPHLSQAWHNLGLLHETLHDDGQALACYLRAKETATGIYAGEPILYRLLLRFGLHCLDLGLADKATEMFKLATALDSDEIEAWSGLASSLTLSGRPLQAMPAFDKALALSPSAANLYNNRANAYRDAGQIEAALADYRQAIRLDPDYKEARSNYLFTMLGAPGQDARGLAELHRQQTAGFISQGAPTRTDAMPATRPYRLGIVSADFRQHPVAWFMLAWFIHRERAAFHLTVYSVGKRRDEITAKLRQTSDAWVECAELDDRNLAERIAADRIDLLLDLAGHTADNRLGVFTLRPAVRQATFLGYAGTTGLGCFDARIADWITEPAGEEPFSSEALVRLEGSYLCYQAPELAPPVTPPPCLKQPHITFGSSTQLGKLSDQTLALWGKTLAAVPKSRLVLRSMSLADPLVRKRLLARLAKAGVDTGRIRLDGPRPLAEHLAAWGGIDITLDTTPFNLATQSCESLWMGVPVVSLNGNRHAGRLGASLLTGAGLTELVASEETGFVECCATLAEDRPSLSELRASLRARLSAHGGLMDGSHFAERLDQALLRILTNTDDPHATA